jgi:glutamine phosphoribosylpyrophosphate amidotransferase
MCAVIGYSGKGGERAAARLLALFDASKIRGLHSFGVAHVHADGALGCDKFLIREQAREYLAALALEYVGRHLSLIAHCRYSTSGDWHDDDANQPIVIGDVAMAFNGVIRMTTKEQWGKEFGFKPETDNDGEIFVRKVLDGEDWEQWVRLGTFSFAGVMLYHGELLALRNRQRPLYHVREASAHYIGSTQDIFRRSGFKLPKSIEAGTTYHVG